MAKSTISAPSLAGRGRPGRRKFLPIMLVGAAIAVILLGGTLKQGRDLQAGYLRSIVIPRQYRVFPHSAPVTCPLSSSSSSPTTTSFSHNATPTALVSYPGSGSTLTRLLLERLTGIHTGSVYGDVSLYNNSGHQFWGEFNITNVSAVKTHYPVGPTHGPEFEYRRAKRTVLLLRDPRKAIPSYLNYQYGDLIGSKHDVQAPLHVWEDWRDETGRVETELQKWINVTKHWAEERFDHLNAEQVHVVLYENLTADRASGVDALQSLVRFLDFGTVSDDAIACVWEEILGKNSQDKGIRRSKNYTPKFTAKQHFIITSGLQTFSDYIGTSGSSPLAQAIRLYSGEMISETEMAEERKWPPPNCEIPPKPAGENICSNGMHTFDCHISVCSDHLIPQQVERYSQINLHEPHESKLFAALMLLAKTDDIFIDVGAAIGYFPALALQINPSMLVYAFDPLIEFKKKLGANIWLNFGDSQLNDNARAVKDVTDRICVDGRAMSNKDGDADWIGDDFGGQIKSKVESDGFGEIAGGNDVYTVRLDTVLKEIDRDPYLLMMDIQGMEKYILNSTFDVLRTGKIKILTIGIHENSLEECRAIVEKSGAYTVVIAESVVPLQPDGILIAVSKEWLRGKEIIDLIHFARPILDETYDNFLAAVKGHIHLL
ncbi:hypothetical protein ACHAWF_008718 [Thalassiosira exigua]